MSRVAWSVFLLVEHIGKLCGNSLVDRGAHSASGYLTRNIYLLIRLFIRKHLFSNEDKYKYKFGVDF